MGIVVVELNFKEVVRFIFLYYVMIVRSVGEGFVLWCVCVVFFVFQIFQLKVRSMST